jgi:Glycosyltransferase family 87
MPGRETCLHAKTVPELRTGPNDRLARPVPRVATMPVPHDPDTPRPFWPPRVEYVALAVILLGLVVLAPMGVAPLPLRDFVEYWSAGDVFRSGGNPYDPEALSASLSNALGEERSSTTMMWNPPWTLPLLVPFAVLPIWLAHLLWVAVQVTLVLVSANWLWRAYSGGPEPGGLFRAAVLLFPATFFLVVYGQIGALCLFGVAGFLYFMDRDQPIFAGFCVALTAIKPHLLFAFGLYLVLEALVSRRDRIAVLSGALAIAVVAAGAWQINPHVYSDYFAALTAPSIGEGFVSVKDWRLPLGSYWLRMTVAPDQFWVQFLPAAVVVLATFVYWRKAPGQRDWLRVTPVLVLASLLAAPYGGWMFDLVLLLIPMVHVVTGLSTRVANLVLVGSIATSIFVLVGMPYAGANALERYVWFAPAVAVAYVAADLCLRRAGAERFVPQAQPPLMRVHA